MSMLTALALSIGVLIAVWVKVGAMLFTLGASVRRLADEYLQSESAPGGQPGNRGRPDRDHRHRALS